MSLYIICFYTLGESELWECNDYSVVPEINDITRVQRGPRTPTGGKIGIVMTSFLSGPVGAPKKPWHKPIAYTNMEGKTEVDSK